MREVKKVLFVTNVPQTYRIPLFNEIAKQLEARGVQFKVLFAASGYKRRKAQIDFSDFRFDYEILKSVKINFGDVEKTMFTYGGLGAAIRRYQPDRIVVAGYSLAAAKIYFRSWFKKIPYLIWSGSVEFPGRFDSALRKNIRRKLIAGASGFIAYGTKAKEYLITMGAAPEKVSIGINTVDTSFFRNKTVRRNAQDGKKHLIYVGYLVPRKNLGKLIEITEQLSKERKDFVLDILGDGSDRQSLEHLVASKNLQDIIRFHGFVQKNDLPKYFSYATAFLFQTDFDIWGLVLNEAMAAGLPVLSSLNAGATTDLIRDGENGFAVDYNNPSKVLEKIGFLIDNPSEAEQIGKRAQQTIEQKASIAVSASGFLNALFHS